MRQPPTNPCGLPHRHGIVSIEGVIMICTTDFYQYPTTFCLLLFLLPTTLFSGRSIHHPRPNTPQLSVTWSDSDPARPEPIYTLTSPFLEEWAIFDRFDLDFHLQHQLPETISYRNQPEKSVLRETINDLIERFLVELHKHKKSSDSFTDFKVLKDDDFNYRRGCGIIIVKLKNYPFVLKLLHETPETFVAPYSKGFVPTFLFTLGGGINRFLAGFTRIPNLYAINEKIAADQRWSQLVSAPRKFFWLPKNVRWFTVTGTNFGQKKLQGTFPSTYGIVCDEIVAERTLQISNKADRKLALDLAHFIGNRIDPHICNFMVEKGTGKIVFIDTEHFASIVGLKEPLVFRSYSVWYLKLSNNCLKKAMFRSKASRAKWATGTPENLVLLPRGSKTSAPAA